MNRMWGYTLGLALLLTAGFAGWAVATYARPGAASGGQVAVDPADAPLPRTGLEVPTKRLEIDPSRGLESLRLYKKDYHFSENWFGRSIVLWQETFEPLAGKSGLHYLEIGVFEGRSFLWMAENVLTHETSRLTGIDPFLFGDSEERFHENLAKYEHPERITVIKGFSQQELPKLAQESVDVVYIDGSHTADDVLADMVMSWELLKEGGLMVLDDYGWNLGLPQELRPMVAIDAFVTTYRYRLQVVHRGYQVVLKKLPGPPCPMKDCSRIGDYLYDWYEHDLTAVDSGAKSTPSEKERAWIEAFLRSRRFGADAGTFLAEDLERLRKESGFPEAMERLGVDLPTP